MYMVVFGGIAKISTDGLPQPIFYLAGICLWNYFAECLTTSSNVFIANEHIFGKVYFPRLIMPLSNVTSALFTLGIQLLLFIGFYIYYFATGVVSAPNVHILLFPFLILILAALGLGFGIIVSSLTTKYRDLSILFTFIVQLWMYATPIIYPLSMLSEKRQWIAVMNPVTSIIETFKYSVTGVGTFSWWNLLYSFGFAVILIFIGVLVFNKVQRSFMDTV
jgi:lipopolysaccharide transport system permease protein